jgi:hypothetical protein
MRLVRPPRPTVAGRTIYESRQRQRSRRRRRRILAAAALAACVAIVAAVLMAGQRGAGAEAGPRATGPTPAAASPSSPPAPAEVRTVALAGATVHRGETVRLRYRIEDPQGRTWSAKLLVLDAGGDAVKKQVVGHAVTAGPVHVVAFPVRLPVGEYTWAIHVQDAQGTTEATATPARLTVHEPLPPAFPGTRAVKAALTWALARSSQVGVAVVDSHGKLWGAREHVAFQTASLAKAMLLVAYLRSHPHADAALDAVATKMIEESDNGSAYAIQGVVGMSGLRKVATLAHMKDFRTGSAWVDSRSSAADQAQLFYRYFSYVPSSRRAFARRLLSGITSMQRWGIPAAAGPERWTPYFKGGWLGTDNHLMVQAGRLEKDGVAWAVAIMTDENPSRSYGWDTEKGFTGLLLGRQPTAAYLARVLE